MHAFGLVFVKGNRKLLGNRSRRLFERDDVSFRFALDTRTQLYGCRSQPYESLPLLSLPLSLKVNANRRCLGKSLSSIRYLEYFLTTIYEIVRPEKRERKRSCVSLCDSQGRSLVEKTENSLFRFDASSHLSAMSYTRFIWLIYE